MVLPFSREEFLGVFSSYNAFAWPASVLAYVLAALVVLAILVQWRLASRFLYCTLALMWAWTGLFYHIAYFTKINTAAWGFGALFLLGALAFGWHYRSQGKLQTAAWSGWRSGLGWLFIAYAMVTYPLIGLALGHDYMDQPQFGTAPCPVTIFTFGLLLIARGPMPWMVLAAPALWSLIGGSAAFLLGVPQDWLLLFSGVISAAAIATRQSQE